MDFGIRDRNRINHRNALGVCVFPMTTNRPSQERRVALERRLRVWGRERRTIATGIDERSCSGRRRFSATQDFGEA